MTPGGAEGAGVSGVCSVFARDQIGTRVRAIRETLACEIAHSRKRDTGAQDRLCAALGGVGDAQASER